MSSYEKLHQISLLFASVFFAYFEISSCVAFGVRDNFSSVTYMFERLEVKDGSGNKALRTRVPTHAGSTVAQLGKTKYAFSRSNPSMDCKHSYMLLWVHQEC